MRSPLMLALLLAVLAAAAADYRGVTLSADRRVLTILTDRGPVQAPRTDPDQEGFDAPQVSPDHRSVGWLVLATNCCTAYPLPTSLVIFRDSKVVHSFSEGMAIWGWSFASDGKAVAYRQHAPHGLSTTAYTLRRLADGKPIGRFYCRPQLDAPAVPNADPGKVPAWVWPVAEECPLR